MNSYDFIVITPVEAEARNILNILLDVFDKEGIEIIRNAELKKVEKNAKGIITRYISDNEEKKIKTDVIFAAVGRVPNISGLALDKAGIECSEKGIKTNQFLQTSTPNIYAGGDIPAAQKFTHTSSYQAKIVVENIVSENKKESDLSVLPWVMFTDPEVAHVGFSEKEAGEILDNISVFKVNAGFDRFITDRNATGFLKVIFDSENIPVGADAIGASAGEWIQLITFAIKNRISAEKFSDMIFAYPTYSEIVNKAFTGYLRIKV